ncbi:protein PHLOEM PROTEIN 2-LIKE A1-like [Euphorbia lathyris]|uniref:protein PHLOEM PROTEIN 2-LIKE A1-like n=1 Tax=Euphorbia lathyris TaxID=212925 RepID=UPI0033140FE8
MQRKEEDMGASWSEDEEATQSQSQSQTNTKTNIQKNTAIAIEVKLPCNYQSIIKEADSPLDTSSSQKLYDQLCNGIFLTQNKKKYWVEKKSNANCFFLYARDLSITWSEDNRFWHWHNLSETSNVTVEVADLMNVCWLEVHGNFETIKLTPNVLYEVAFVLMLKDPAYGLEDPVNFRLTLPNGNKQLHKENLLTKPRGQWIEIPAGEFVTSPENVGEIEISMFEYEGGKWKKGLTLKGLTIRPKSRS